jgi:uncharacterized protein YjiS (DUF1127 family)
MKSFIALRSMASIEARESATNSIVQIIASAIGAFTEDMKMRHTRRDLRRLDDHLLRDIGLSRYDVEFGNPSMRRISEMSAKGHPEGR